MFAIGGNALFAEHALRLGQVEQRAARHADGQQGHAWTSIDERLGKCRPEYRLTPSKVSVPDKTGVSLVASTCGAHAGRAGAVVVEPGSRTASLGKPRTSVTGERPP